MINKRFLFVTLATATISSFLIAMSFTAIDRNNAHYEIINATGNDYSLNLSSLNDSSTSLVTSSGNTINFESTGLNNGLAGNGYLKNLTAISGLESLTITFANPNSELLISYGWNDGYYFVEDQVIDNSHSVYNFGSEHPSFFYLRNATNAAVEVSGISLTYSCQATSLPDKYDGLYYYLNNSNTAYNVCIDDRTIKYAVIKEQYQGLPVTAITNLYYVTPQSLEKIYIPGSIRSISNQVFYNSKLKNVVLPEGIQTLGSTVFQSCKQLESVVLPDSLTSAGDHLFYQCTALESVSIGSGLTSIPEYAFEGCTSLSSVTLSSGLQTIGGFAFYDCDALQTITLPNTLTAIGNSAFRSSGLTQIEIPASVSSIGMDVFESCTSLTSVKTNEGLLSVGIEAFANCTALSFAYLSSTITSMGNNAFYRCSSLTIGVPDLDVPAGWASGWNPAGRSVVLYSYEPVDVADQYYHHVAHDIVYWTNCSVSDVFIIGSRSPQRSYPEDADLYVDGQGMEYYEIYGIDEDCDDAETVVTFTARRPCYIEIGGSLDYDDDYYNDEDLWAVIDGEEDDLSLSYNKIIWNSVELNAGDSIVMSYETEYWRGCFDLYFRKVIA